MFLRLPFPLKALYGKIFSCECPVCRAITDYPDICENCDRALDICKSTVKDFVIPIDDYSEVECKSVYMYNRHPVEELLFHIKRKGSGEAVRYAASRLVAPANEFDLGDNTYITYIPRSKAGLREYGFDQGKLLAKSLALFLGGIKVKSFILRRAGLLEQKKLSAGDRRLNAGKAFKVSPLARFVKPPESIIIIDDVCTTGASLFECASIIHNTFPKTKIFALFIANT